MPASFGDLRERIAAIERSGGALRKADAAAVPIGVPEIDTVLPGGGFARGALHELAAGADGGSVLGADGAALGFGAVLLARLAAEGRPVLWCLNADLQARMDGLGDPYGPGLAEFGLMPDAVLFARTRRDGEALWAMEEGLRTPALAAVAGEVGEIGLVESRRLQLAAAGAGTTAILFRPATARLVASAAVTRWRLAALPAVERGAANLPEPRWRADLVRCRGGRPQGWNLVWRGRERGLAVAPEGMAADAPAPAAARSG